MKNVVIRIRDGTVCISAPIGASIEEIDKIVELKSTWIAKQLAKPIVPKVGIKHYDTNDCLEKFVKIAEYIYPLISDKLPGQPKMYVKTYKSRWGVCYIKRGYIILNTQLFDKPIAAIEYVILHEYVHFIVPNHGEKFHEIMRKLMPDYLARRRMLRE